MLMLFSEQARWRPGARGEHVGDPWCRVMLNNSAKRSAEPQETATNCGDALFTGCHVNCETVRKQVRCRVANGNHLNQGFFFIHAVGIFFLFWCSGKLFSMYLKYLR